MDPGQRALPSLSSTIKFIKILLFLVEEERDILQGVVMQSTLRHCSAQSKGVSYVTTLLNDY